MAIIIHNTFVSYISGSASRVRRSLSEGHVPKQTSLVHEGAVARWNSVLIGGLKVSSNHPVKTDSDMQWENSTILNVDIPMKEATCVRRKRKEFSRQVGMLCEVVKKAGNEQQFHAQCFGTLIQSIAADLDSQPIDPFLTLLWAVGKLGVSEETCIAKRITVNRVCQRLHSEENWTCFTVQDLCGGLWGLAHIEKHFQKIPNLRAVAERAVAEITQRIGKDDSATTSQCISNSMWAVATLSFSWPVVESLVWSCMHNIYRKDTENDDRDPFLPQGCANTMWAVAKILSNLTLHEEADAIILIRLTAIKLLKLAEKLVEQFQPLEVSMFVWGVAKIFCRNKPRSCQVRKEETETARLAMKCGFEVPGSFDSMCVVSMIQVVNIDRFNSQGLTNVVWSLAKLNMLRHRPRAAAAFVVNAAKHVLCENLLGRFRPQAIGNFIWAVVRLNKSDREDVKAFALKVTEEVESRFDEFAWQDLSSIGLSLVSGYPEKEEVKEMLRKIVRQLNKCRLQPSTWVKLNIMVAAVRMHLDSDDLTSLISKFAEKHNESKSNFDKRQWDEIKRHSML